MTAIRLARGFTGRSLIVKFEGCYHGHADSLLVKAGSGALTLGGGTVTISDTVTVGSSGGQGTLTLSGATTATLADKNVGTAKPVSVLGATLTGTITNRVWSFGDGGASSALNPIHNYTNPGVFSVSLTVFGVYYCGLLVGEELYVVTDGGIATCLDAATGAVTRRVR